MMLRFPLPRLLLAAALSFCAAHGFAAVTDISQAPLIISNQDAVKANLLFVLDDSGSMNFDFLPDHINGSDGATGANPALCRSAGATGASSGSFGNACCQRGNVNNACWTGTPPFSYSAHPPFLAAGFNGLAYNPAVVYAPPVKADGSYWPSQTRTATNGWTAVKNDAYNVQNTSSINLITQFPDTQWCFDSALTDCLRNGNYALPGTVNGKAYTRYSATVASGSGLVTTGSPDNAVAVSRDFGPHYYVINTPEYCNSIDLRDCRMGSTGNYTIPAPVRWCNSDTNARALQPAVAACQAVRSGTFSFPRYPTKYFSSGSAGTNASLSFTVTLTGCSSGKVAGIQWVKVAGVDLFAGSPTGNTATASTLASAVVSAINANTVDTGFFASASNATVTLYATINKGAVTSSASLAANTSSTCTVTPTTLGSFSGYSAPTSSYPGSFQRVDITPGTTANPNVFARPSSRADCSGIAGGTSGNCTYDEEMTNFANWWTYYHTRMQSMKSSAASAFGALGSNRRVGYLSINNATGSDFLNLNTFETTQRSSWFNKLTAAKPSGSTPLRAALATAGRLYGGRFNGTTLNGSTVTDPMQYSCQRNFTVLSTDGFWNESNNPVQLNGSTAIGDQDSGLDRPMMDGNGTANTLADVAAYYYGTDLRTGTTGQKLCVSGGTSTTTPGTGADVCGNDDPSPSINFQRMFTFTLGLGASGYMQFTSDYLSGGSKDFNAISQVTAADPSSGVCSWQTSGTCNWPTPVSNTLTAVDDLWHAAVNGHGTYFSASDPSTLYNGLSSALRSIGGVAAAAAAATTSNPNVSQGDNQIFQSNFQSAEWSGELKATTIDLNSGAVSDTATWSAQGQLDTNASRTLYMRSSGATNGLKAFSWAAMSTGERAYFGKNWITAASGSGNSGPSLSQLCTGAAYCLTTDAQNAAVGEPLVSYLAGDRSNEGDLGTTTKFYRPRVHLLGDIVNSEVAYVAKSLVTYTDDGYGSFALQQAANNPPMAYVGANDGMLHAFNASTGAEVWAYVPTAVLPNLYRLADKQYAANHQYYVDGSPVVQDIKIGTQWRTILVSGLGAGGNAYFALDITDPANPKSLWEFTDANLGLTVGRPEIGKLTDGTWVVIFASGYNNTADGLGRLYVLNAATGAVIRTIATTAGSAATPSGLAHIRAWVDNSVTDNTIQRVYGGDNLGNLWRFDVNNNVGAPGYEALQLATLSGPTGVTQPITSRPELGQVGSYVMVFVGTGRYLGQSDLTNADVQSIYGIKDPMTASGIGTSLNPRSTANQFVQQTLTLSTSGCPTGSSACQSGDTVRTNSNNSVNLAVNGGWFVDLPMSRERVNTDPQLALGTLVVNSNVIAQGDLCKVGGSSWSNVFNYATGGAVDSSKGVSSVALGNAIATRPALVRLPNNKVISITRLSDVSTAITTIPTSPALNTTRRLSWRDLLQQ
ncbi:pilus assembly protein [Roseateles sp.]|uniref:pilus assembly protein n=1 Tax=Roseateles sp. TaxID=1971397 RepID=UPI003BACD386